MDSTVYINSYLGLINTPENEELLKTYNIRRVKVWSTEPRTSEVYTVEYDGEIFHTTKGFEILTIISSMRLWDDRKYIGHPKMINLSTPPNPIFEYAVLTKNLYLHKDTEFVDITNVQYINITVRGEHTVIKDLKDPLCNYYWELPLEDLPSLDLEQGTTQNIAKYRLEHGI